MTEEKDLLGSEYRQLKAKEVNEEKETNSLNPEKLMKKRRELVRIATLTKESDILNLVHKQYVTWAREIDFKINPVNELEVSKAARLADHKSGIQRCIDFIEGIVLSGERAKEEIKKDITIK